MIYDQDLSSMNIQIVLLQSSSLNSYGIKVSGDCQIEVNKLQLPLEYQQQQVVAMENLIAVPSKHVRANSSENVSSHMGRDSVGVKEHRPANTVSMYVGIGKQKILPKTVTDFQANSGSKRSQSIHLQKPQHKSLLRYRKIDATTNDASFSALNPLKQFKRQTLRGQVRAALTNSDKNLKNYLQIVEKAEGQFIGHCQQQKQQEYVKAAQVIIRLLNFSVDFNVPEQFLRALKFLADFHFHTDKIEQAVFYYDQTRQACLLLDHRVLLVESLIGLAECCGKVGVESEGIRILKKALEYSWLRGLEEQELRIYDEIGKMHYYLGDLQKARQYHSRHINALHQPVNSALRQLSKQRIIKSEQINLQTKYKEINRLLLVHLKVPIRSLDQVPLPYEQAKNNEPIRKFYDLSNKYFGGEEAAAEIRHILRGWFFREQIEDPYLPESDWSSSKPKKYAFLDFQLNQQLKRLEGNGKSEKQKLSRSAFPVKESLQEQIARKIKEPPLKSDWYQKIVNQINRDHRNKLLNVRNAIRIRGFNKKVIPSLEILKDLYNSLFERSKQFSGVVQNGNYLN